MSKTDSSTPDEGYSFIKHGGWMGKADWLWNESLGIHLPCCRVGNGYGGTCGNGPLVGDQIKSGDCGEHNGIRCPSCRIFIAPQDWVGHEC